MRIANVVVEDLRAGGDDKKRFFLIGTEEARPPVAGYGLLIVLPGGDGSAEFHPFIRRMHEDALNYAMAYRAGRRAEWDDKQLDRVVWPTVSLPYPGARFTTEALVRDILADVRAREKIDPKRVFLLGWSSGGPPCYAIATSPDSGVAGAFIAMSVFHAKALPTLEAARGRAFYLLQSPQDRVTPMRFAEAAEEALRAAGAKVELRRYEGGHGWRGDIRSMIGDGVSWLDRQASLE